MTCKAHQQDNCIACTFLPQSKAAGKPATKAKRAAEPAAPTDGYAETSFKGRLRVCEVVSDSNPNRAYAVCIKDGIWECACPAWTRGTVARAKARETATGGTVQRMDCKHIQRVLRWLANTESGVGTYGDGFTFKVSLATALGRGIRPCQQWQGFAKHGTPDQHGAVLVILPLLASDDTLTVAGAWNSIWTVMTMAGVLS